MNTVRGHQEGRPGLQSKPEHCLRGSNPATMSRCVGVLVIRPMMKMTPQKSPLNRSQGAGDCLSSTYPRSPGMGSWLSVHVCVCVGGVNSTSSLPRRTYEDVVVALLGCLFSAAPQLPVHTWFRSSTSSGKPAVTGCSHTAQACEPRAVHPSVSRPPAFARA